MEMQSISMIPALVGQCQEALMRRYMALIRKVDEVRVDGDQGWVTSHFEHDGEEIDIGAEEEPTFEWQDSEWVSYVSPEEMAEENPCSLDFG